MSECKACFEEFLPKLEDDDLCPECMDALRDGGQEIILGKHDGAIILRSDSGEGFTKEIYFPNAKDENDNASGVTIAIVMHAIGMDDPIVQARCVELFDLGLEKVKEEESVDRAVAEQSEESPDSKE